MTEFGLEDDSWLNSMYDIRQFWIPAYFRDFFLGGLCRTTSISESVNNFYSGYLNKNSNLLAFFIQFESALDSQRHSNERLNSADESRSPQLSMPLSFEKHAATVYTIEIFLKVQKEIEDACYVCIVNKIHDHESTREYWVDDCKNGSFRVVLNKVDNSITCSCKKFVMVGLLCCHVFVILKDLKLATIPDTYVISRWTKSARFHQIYDTTALFEQQLEVIDENKLIMNQLISEFYRGVGFVDGNNGKMTAFLLGIRQLLQSLEYDEGSSSSISKNKNLFDNFYGISTPTEVHVLPPNQVKTKGSGSRMKPRREKEIEKKNKPLRKCSNCKRMVHHDARNCDQEPTNT